MCKRKVAFLFTSECQNETSSFTSVRISFTICFWTFLTQKEFAERGRIGKVQTVSYLSNCQLCSAKQERGLHDQKLIDISLVLVCSKASFLLKLDSTS